jgi:hypothetical protein
VEESLIHLRVLDVVRCSLSGVCDLLILIADKFWADIFRQSVLLLCILDFVAEV